MKKINWFTRLFMSWTTLINYILNDNASQNIEDSNGKEKIATLTEEIKGLKARLDDLKQSNDDNKKYFEEEKTQNIELNAQLVESKNKTHIMDTRNSDLTSKSIIQEKDIKDLTDQIMGKKHEYKELQKNIYEKLNPLDRIQKTFFAESGNKGKAMLGEKQLKITLEKAGLSDSFWTENLMVGANQVEFAIKPGNSDRWIPVDSKVLDTEVNDANEIIVDSKYRSRVLTQAKKITKYLDKKNTTPYGLLVLQSDAIYIQLFEKYPTLFQEVINKYKIHICSPASFIQFAWSVSYILDIYEKVNSDEKIYDQMIDALKIINKFSKSLINVHNNFNTAMTTHYPALHKKQNILIKKLDKDGKIKEAPALLKLLDADNNN